MHAATALRDRPRDARRFRDGAAHAPHRQAPGRERQFQPGRLM